MSSLPDSLALAEVIDYVRAELAEGHDVSLTNAEMALLMHEFDHRGHELVTHG
jgi:hypothetical protein